MAHFFPYFTLFYLSLTFSQPEFPFKYIVSLVSIIVDHIDIGWNQPSYEKIVIIQMIIEFIFHMQHTGSRICYSSLRKWLFDLFMQDCYFI